MSPADHTFLFAEVEAVAAGGEVLVSEETLGRAGGQSAISVGERRLHWLKNVTEPVAARAAEPHGRLRRPTWKERLRNALAPRGSSQIAGGHV
jgi:class 3 adenylate cyclase